MTALYKRNASFVVRIWWEQKSRKLAVWRGQIIHVQTGQTFFIQDENALLNFIRRWTGTSGPQTDESISSRPPHKENLP